MRCSYCDTAYAFHGGKKRTLADIEHEVASYNTQYVTVTGGEPLVQPECLQLLTNLCDAGHKVSLETGGACSIELVDPRVYTVLDIKTPASNEEPKNLYSNLEHIKPTDSLKFVICNQQDYEWSREFVRERQLMKRCEIFFSPSANELNPTELAEWILRDQLPIRMQIQLHKILWEDAEGR